MTTISIPFQSNTPSTGRIRPESTDGTAGSWHQEPVPLPAEPAFLSVEDARDTLRARLESRPAVAVVEGRIRINEATMMQNYLYPVTVEGNAYYVILWSHDHTLEIFGAA